MAKEVTLADFLKDAPRGQQRIAPNMSMSSKPSSKMVAVNPSDIVKQVNPGGDTIEDETPEILDDAFKAMTQRISAIKAEADSMYEQAVENALELEAEGYEPTEEDIEAAQAYTAAEIEMNEKLNGAKTLDTDRIKVIGAEEDISELPEIKPADREINEDLITDNVNKIDYKPVEVKEVVEDTVDDLDDISLDDDEEEVKKEEEPEEDDLDQLDSDLDELLDEIPGDKSDEKDESLDDIEDDIDDIEESAEETRDRLKKSLNEFGIGKKADVRTFRTVDKPVSASAALRNIEATATKKKADWPLYHTGINVTFVECSGLELDNLRASLQNLNNIDSITESLRFVYNHIDSACKPNTFEAWTKLIRTEDIESLYFGVYLATYGKTSNVLALQCPEKPEGCGKVVTVKPAPLDMVKYEDDEVKAKFAKLMRQDTTTQPLIEEDRIIPISDSIAISYAHPTLYNTFIQFSALPSKIIDKYSQTLDSLAYVNKFYAINAEEGTISPINLPFYPNNFNKTVLTKLKFYTNVLQSLSADDHVSLQQLMANNVETPKITFINPESTCPECGAVIPESAVDSTLNLLFTRSQLATIAVS